MGFRRAAFWAGTYPKTAPTIPENAKATTTMTGLKIKGTPVTLAVAPLPRVTIMVTAKVEEVDRLIGLELGADDYICKPFSPREVVARVKAVLRRLSVGPLTLDEDTRQVTANGQPVGLTPSEFGLLNVLMTFPERVFSRAELLDKVQGYRFDGYDAPSTAM